MTRFWVDYNDLGAIGKDMLSASITKDIAVNEGDLCITYDGDGNTAKGRVVKVRPAFRDDYLAVDIRVDMETWEAA